MAGMKEAEQKRIYCTSCGAYVGENEEKCPYCGAINPTGAEAAHMRRLNRIRSDMAQMEDDLEETYVRELKSRGSRIAKTTVCIILAAAAIAAAGFLMNRISESRYSRQLEQELAFERAYFPQLNRIYDEGDDDATLEYLYSLYSLDGASVLWSWPHHDYFQYYSTYRQLQEAGKMMAGETEKNEDLLTWLVYDILTDQRAEYRTVDDAHLDDDEREKVLTWQEEEEIFLTERLGLTEPELDEIWQKSLHRSGSFADYEKMKKALAPYLKRWTGDEQS